MSVVDSIRALLEIKIKLEHQMKDFNLAFKSFVDTINKQTKI